MSTKPAACQAGSYELKFETNGGKEDEKGEKRTGGWADGRERKRELLAEERSLS